MPHDVFTCEPGWEGPLDAELAQVFPSTRGQSIAPGWVVVEPHSVGDRAFVPCVALAEQCLPAAELIEAESISVWARSSGGRLIEALQAHDGPWRLHVFHAPVLQTGGFSRRCQFIADELLALLKKKQRRLLRAIVAEPDAPASGDEALVQIGLVGPTMGYLSICLPEARWRWRRCLSRFPGGGVEVPADRAAPSRAFAKLREVELRLAREIQPGETCVDLGSSPGSWAYLALRRGAAVTAVDRSPLRDDLMTQKGLTFVRGDAFAFAPPARVDWLLSDVIAFPERIVELLEIWLTRRWCRRFCVTIKFRGDDQYARLDDAKRVLNQSGAEFVLRRLTHNKNEVTAFGEIA